MNDRRAREFRRVELLMAAGCWFESSWLGRRLYERQLRRVRRELPPGAPGGGLAGVREPRRPRPAPPDAAAAVVGD